MVTRLVATELGKALGQPAVVDNKPGAGTVIGVDMAAKAPADGHTVSSNSRHTLNITPRQLAKVPRVIAAAADPRKAAAVHAVCRSGILTDLVVDVELATALLGRSPVTETFHAARPATDG